MFLKQLFALILRTLFKVKPLQSHYYGLYKRIIRPFRLFHGVSRTIRFRSNLILDLDIEDWIPQQLYLLGKYEERELKFVTKYLKPGDLFVDIGANFGLYSLVASEIVGDMGSIYAFEPYPDNYIKLVRHLKRNSIRNVVAERLAISSSESTIKLNGTNDNLNSGMISEFSGVSAAPEVAGATSLDSYAEMHFERPVKLIKIDIEGGEYKALLGMQNRILKVDRPCLLMELDDVLLLRAGTSVTAIETMLSSFSYTKYFLNEDGGLTASKPTDDNSLNCVFVPL